MAYIGKQPTVGNFVKLDAITTSATATYNLLNGGVAYSPQSANHCIVSLNGVIQEPTSASNVGGFTISGSTIVFTSALTSSDVIDFILVLGDVLNIGTPSDATVGFSKVTSNLITGATAETTIAGGDSVLIYDDSASALRKMTRTNFVAGVGGTNTPAFRATMSTGQSIANGTFTKLNFNTETYDTDNCYDNATNYRFTPTTAGKYFVYGYVRCQNSTQNSIIDVAVALRKNGSDVAQTYDSTYNDAIQHDNTSFVYSIVSFNGSTDYVELFGNVYSNAGTGNFDADNSRFGAYKLIGA